MRHLKSQREINLMRTSGLVVWEAHQLAASMVNPGVTTREINRAVDEFLIQRQAVSLFKNYPHSEKGKPPFPAATCTSVNEEVVHGIPKERPLKEGDVVSIDIGCVVNGWCGDAAVTHPVGDVHPRVQQLLDVTHSTLELAIELMGKKTRWSHVAAEMDRFVSDHGFATVECFVGHGIGREMHEDPQVPNFVNRQLRRSGDFTLEPGLVIAVEPMVNMGTKRVRSMPDQWTQSTADGKPSAHFEHTVAITRDGPRPLTAAPTPNESVTEPG